MQLHWQMNVARRLELNYSFWVPMRTPFYSTSVPMWAIAPASQADHAMCVASVTAPQLTRHVRHFSPHEGFRDSFASGLRHVGHFTSDWSSTSLG